MTNEKKMFDTDLDLLVGADDGSVSLFLMKKI